jgi:hypothetical protein
MTRAIHMVSAFAARQRLVLGQVKVADKSNEIIAIPALLDMLVKCSANIRGRIRRPARSWWHLFWRRPGRPPILKPRGRPPNSAKVRIAEMTCAALRSP